ncbi:hypothetical protein VNO78_25784 [Psophocarpus tetragonolobus]|uniref:Uncharacterized protein n=1 Tax=Psophocarpus tetragonolobus TaxID=3891 RepID=A0AAN9XFA5_PSOTE
MELRCCGNLHFIQAIKGGLVTKVPNIARRQSKLKFKKLTDVYDGFLSHNDDGMVERSCLGEIEESTLKTKADALVCNVNNDDDQRIINLDDDDFDNFTLSQFKESCKTRKRKRSQGLNSSKINIKVEDSSFQEDYREEQMAADDSDFMETLGSLKSKLSKNVKGKKKKCFKEPISVCTKEIMVVVKSEEILCCAEFPPSSEEIQKSLEIPPSSDETQDSQEFSLSSDVIQDDQVFSPFIEEIQNSQEFPPSSVKIQDSQEFSPSSEVIQDSQVFPPSSEEIQDDQEFPPSSDEIQDSPEFSPSSEVIRDGQGFQPYSEEIQEGQEFSPSSEEIQDTQVFPTSSEEIPDSQEFPSYSEDIENDEDIPCFSGDSVALVEVKSEVPETDYFGRSDDYSIIECKKAKITYEWNLENQLNDWRSRVDFIPLRMVKPCSTISNSQLTNDQSPNLLAIEFESDECIIHPDLHYVPPQLMFIEDHNSDIHDNQCDAGTGTTVLLPNVATHQDVECIGVEFKDDDNFLDCSNDEFTTDAQDQVEVSPTIEHVPNPDVCLVNCSDSPPEYEEKQSYASVNNDEKRYVNEATDELTSGDECNASSKLRRPERLLSTRKTISPSSQEKLCKAVESIEMNHKSNLKCKGKLYFSEPTDKMNVTTEGLDVIRGARFADVPSKISVIPRTKRVSNPKGISKNPHSSRQASRLGCNTVQSCSKSAIAFTQQQMHDVECLATKLTKELKSMKDIMDEMLRSEFCLNTSLRHKVNEARIAVKNATRAEETAKRCLAFMSRDCSRFCKIMKLADDNGSPPQDVAVRKEKKKIAFADEAGGRLCQVKFYEDDGIALSESN